jgi:glyoxylase-like metal-dependent hydrolase (beta-lactamase superfamily II)
MTEPVEIADHAHPVVDGVWHWQVRNSGIGGAISSAHLVQHAGHSVLVDPVQLADPALDALPAPDAIVLTAKCHQRSAWRYRLRFSAQVWAPVGTRPMDEEPDRRYEEGDPLPAGLRPVRTPGPEPIHYCLLLEDEPGILFCSDLLSSRDGSLDFVPLQYHDDPPETRRSVEHLLTLPFSVLCLDHGSPITSNPKEEIRKLLARTA